MRNKVSGNVRMCQGSVQWRGALPGACLAHKGRASRRGLLIEGVWGTAPPTILPFSLFPIH